MSKYRFKTKEEFKADGQWDKIDHCPIGWNSEGEMNHYLGQDVPEGANESIENGQYFYEDGKYFYIDGWTFESTNCILKENVSFEKGKWYKGEANNYYIKFDRIEKDDGFNNIYYTERIYSKEYKKISDCWANNDFESYALHNPVDLSEIQEFLPDNHEDKIVKEEDYTGMYIKALVESPNCTGVCKGDSIKIISKKNETQYVLDKTRLGIPGMEIRCPLDTSQWELVEEPKQNSKVVPGYVKCVQELIHAKVGKVYPVVDEKHCLCENGDTYEWDAIQFTAATKQEYDAQFSNEQDPLYICKQKYRKGMRVRSAIKTGMYSGEFIIDVEPDKFYNINGKDTVDYFKSKGYLYFNGEYAEILEEGVYDISEIIKTKPSIEPVQSVDVKLRTKKQINKHLKF
jgi:hypothetical protein